MEILQFCTKPMICASPDPSVFNMVTPKYVTEYNTSVWVLTWVCSITEVNQFVDIWYKNLQTKLLDIYM